MRYVILIIILFIFIFIAVLIFGLVLSPEYESAQKKSFAIPIETAWDFYSNVENFPKFRNDYYAVQVLNERKGHPFQWQVYTTDGKLAVYQVNNLVKNKHLSIQLIRSNNKMTGTWDYFFYGDSLNCTVEISERSRMDDPIEKVYWYLTGRNNRIEREFSLFSNYIDQEFN